MEKNTEIDNEAIGQRIREGREKFKLSREEFAEIIGLSDYYVGQLERGERQMSLPVLVKVASCLHVSLDYLVWGKITYDEYCIRDGGSNYSTLNNSNDRELHKLIDRCSPKELKLLTKLIKTVLPYVDKN